MRIDDDRKQGGNRLGPFGIPLWAWGAGLTLGLVFGMLLFDGPVGLIFAVSIGTAFAMAFAGNRTRRKRESWPGQEVRPASPVGDPYVDQVDSFTGSARPRRRSV